MSSGQLIPWVAVQFVDANGNPLDGGKLFSYQAGTTTPLATYTDSTLGTPNTNPVILDSAGSASVWIGSGAFKFVLEDANSSVIWTRDNVVMPGNSVSVSLTSQVTGVLPLANGGTGQATQQDALNALTGTQSSGKYLRSDGTNSALAVIQAADVPTLNQNTSGTASNVTGTVAIAHGGTSLATTPTDGQVLIGNTSTNAYALATLTAGTNITITNGHGTILIAASSAATPAYNFTAQTSTYSAVIGDWVSCSSTSFAVTLPTAVGGAGKSIIIQHNGTSLSQVYTLNTTSSQTIGGIATGVYQLFTKGEALTLASDGSNWQILDHKTLTGVINAGALTITGSTTSPTKGTNTIDKFLWSRDGSNMNFWYHYNQTAAGAAGTGDYSLNLPTGLTIDSSLVTLNTTVYGLSTADLQAMTIFGSGHLSAVTSNMVVYAATTSTMKIWVTGVGVWSASEGALSNTTFSVGITGKVPIANWQP